MKKNFLTKFYETVDDILNSFSNENSEKLFGGKADGKTIEDIAQKHNVSVEEIQKQIEIGKKIEMEHTDNEEIAIEISKDHLWEFSDYYTRLQKMEKEGEKALENKG